MPEVTDVWQLAFQNTAALMVSLTSSSCLCRTADIHSFDTNCKTLDPLAIQNSIAAAIILSEILKICAVCSLCYQKALTRIKACSEGANRPSKISIARNILLYSVDKDHHGSCPCSCSAETAFWSSALGGLILMQVSSDSSKLATKSTNPSNQGFGIMCMVLAGFFVSLSGICTEGILDNSDCFVVLPIHLRVCLWNHNLEGKNSRHSKLDHFTGLFWAFVVLEALGGFLVDWCVRVVGTVEKNYAQGMGFLLAALSPLQFSDQAVKTQVCATPCPLVIWCWWPTALDWITACLGACLGAVFFSQSGQSSPRSYWKEIGMKGFVASEMTTYEHLQPSVWKHADGL
jgi:Nucleotide-sugar transporter